MGLKRVADGLTASRVLIACGIVLLSLGGKEALSWMIYLIILGWTTDVLDGELARRAHRRLHDQGGWEQTWLGAHDFALDMVMVYASFLYLTLVGYVPPTWTLGYTLIAAAFILLAGGSKSVTEIFAFPLVALPLLIAYREGLWVAYAYIAWIVVMLVLFWGRFVGVVREFIAGMRQLLRV